MPLLRALFVLLLLALPARADPAAEWERLPDGRVVIEIYGRRFAFPPDLPPGMVVFQHGARDVPLQQLIADRPTADRWWSGSHPLMPVGIALSTRLVVPLLFEGPDAVDPRTIYPGPHFWIWVYQDHEQAACRRPLYDFIRRDCEYFIERSRDASAFSPDGFVVERPAMLRGTNQTYYVFPESEGRVARGDPAYIACQTLWGNYRCENGSSRWGYFLRPGIFLRYAYATSMPKQRDMRRIDDAFRAAALRFLLDDSPPR